MGVAASGKCRILITMRFKANKKWAPEKQNSTSVRQAQGRRALERKCKVYTADFVALLKMLFFS